MKRLLLLTIMMFMPLHVLAESGSKGGDEFRKTAVEYEKKAVEAKFSDKPNNAKIYLRQAEIKRAAARLADEGQWSEIDWAEYHQLNTELDASSGKKHQ